MQVRGPESQWQDDAWDYGIYGPWDGAEDPCPHGNGWDCHQCHVDSYLAAARAPGEIYYDPDFPPPGPRDLLSRWLAIIIVAAMAALCVAGAAWLCEVIGL